MKEHILRSLAQYKYLTVSHFLLLGVSKSPTKIREYLRTLRTQEKFTDKATHIAIPPSPTGKIARRVRHEDLHYLTHKGASFLDEETELALPYIRYPKNPKQTLSNDYLHRISTVSLHISFDRWVEAVGYATRDFLVYYDKRGLYGESKTFKSETRIDFEDGTHYSPDAILSYQKPNGQPLLFCLEVYNGNRTKYALEQLKKLFGIIEQTTKIGDKVGLQKTPRILCVFDNPTLLNNTIDRIKADRFFAVQGIEQMLLFNLDEQVWQNFGGKWVNIYGVTVDLEQL